MSGPIFHVPDVDELPETPDAETPGGDPTAIGGQVPPDLTVIQGGAAAVTTEQVAALVELPFAIAALRRGRHWKLADDEAELVADPLARIVNRHMVAARAINAAGDGLSVTLAIGLLVSARIMEDNDRGSRDNGSRRTAAAGNDRGTGRVPEPSPGQPGERGHRFDAGRPGGSLNGINGYRFPPGGSDDGQAPEAAPAEAPGDVLGQALNF